MGIKASDTKTPGWKYQAVQLKRLAVYQFTSRVVFST